MKIELWGVRGSLPSPLTNKDYQKKLREVLTRSIEEKLSPATVDSFISSLPPRLNTLFGGNTSCICLTSSSGRIYIIDAGTGIRPLGDQLMESSAGKGSGEISLFFTHTHWDHIQGLPFFKPLYIKGNRFNFYSPIADLHDRLTYQQTFRFFPVEFDSTECEKEFHLLKKGQTLEPEPGLLIDFLPLKHPGGSVAYRFREKGKSFIFCTDVEITGSTLETQGKEYDDFFMNADLLVLDSQYTLDEAFLKFDWGHTAYTMAVNAGVRWEVNRLVLTHHEPSYSDEKLESILELASLHLKEHNRLNSVEGPEIHLATEGTVFEL